MPKNIVYEPISSENPNDLKSILNESNRMHARRSYRFVCGSYVPNTGSLILFVASVIIFIAACLRRPSELECHKLISPWSPMWEAAEFWEGDLTNYFNHSTKYRGPPTPEREHAWEELWHFSDAGVAALNKTQHGRHIEAVGSDPENPMYGSIVEVFHQLHCLNLIRQYGWLQQGAYNASEVGILYPDHLEDPVGGRMHVDHCFEALRLSLMCYGDITLASIEYDDNRAVGRVADFSVHHKYRKFDKIVGWVKENGVFIPFAEDADPHA